MTHAPPAQVSPPRGKPLEAADPLATLAYRSGLVLLFLQFSMAHEILGFYLGGVRLYIMYLLIPLCLGSLCLSNRINDALRHRGALLWIAFTVWMIVCIPFSSWPGGSVNTVTIWLKGSIVSVIVYAGAIRTWPQARMSLYVLGAALPVNILAARLFSRDGSRLALEFGTVGNANDLAAHLVLVCAGTMFIVISRRGLIRYGLFASVLYALYLAFSTASRGALVAIAAAVLVFLLRGSMRQRAAILVAGPIAAIVIFQALPAETTNRLFSFKEDATADAAAIESSKAREYVFWASVEHTLRNPLFGVGAGQFGSYEGQRKLERGGTGIWYSTHNTITQASSENGIPGALFFCGAIFVTWQTLNRVRREALNMGHREMAAAAFWLTVGFAGFTVAALFLNLAYLFHFPSLTGLAIALSNALEQEKRLRAPVRQQQVRPVWSAPVLSRPARTAQRLPAAPVGAR